MAATYIGYAEYWGEQHVYDGHDYPVAEGAISKIIKHLKKCRDQEKSKNVESYSWRGQNGWWYQGEKAVDFINEEIDRIRRSKD
jgi:hypothetical protein